MLAGAAALIAFGVAYKKIADEESVNDRLRETIDLMGKTAEMGKQAGLSQESLRGIAAISADAANKIGETKTQTELFTNAVTRAASQVKPLTGEIKLWVSEQDKAKTAVKSHVVSLQEQIEKQRDLVKSLEKQIDKDEELTAATQKLNSLLKQQAEEIKKPQQEFEKLANTVGVKLTDSYKQAFDRSVQLMDAMVAQDLSKGIADAIVNWKGFGDSMIRIAKEFGTGILRTLIEQLFSPLKQMLETAAGWLAGIFGGGKAGAGAGAGGGAGGGFSLSGLFSGFKGLGGLLSGVGLVGATAGKNPLLAGAGGFLGGGLAGAAIGGSSLLAGTALGAFAGPIGAVVGLGVGLGTSLFGRGRKEADQLGPSLVSALDASGAITDALKALDAAGKVTIQDLLAAKAGLTGIRDEFFRLTEDFKRAGPGARQTFDQMFTKALIDIDQLEDKLSGQLLDAVRGALDEIAATGGVTDQILTNLAGIAEQLTATGRQAETAAGKLAFLGAQFIQTGKMTNDFAAALQAAGGSAEFFTTVSGQISKLQGLRGEFAALKQAIDSLLPKQRTWQEEFLETGQITDQMRIKIATAGGDIEAFKKFADMRGVRANFEKLMGDFTKTGKLSDELFEKILQFGSAEALKPFVELVEKSRMTGTSLGDLAKGSEGSAAVIQKAFESAGLGINAAFEGAAKTLSDALDKMDQNLGAAIKDLQGAMVTMIKDLIDVLLGVPGAAEKAATDANFYLGTIKSKEVEVSIKMRVDRLLGTDDPIENWMRARTGGFGGVPWSGPLPDPDGLKKMVETQVAPYLVRMLENNRGDLKQKVRHQLRQ